jgi:hypothetical protein
MTHTFCRLGTGHNAEYQVGHYLPPDSESATHEWHPLFNVRSLRAAVAAVSCLNGGKGKTSDLGFEPVELT